MATLATHAHPGALRNRGGLTGISVCADAPAVHLAQATRPRRALAAVYRALTLRDATRARAGRERRLLETVLRVGEQPWELLAEVGILQAFLLPLATGGEGAGHFCLPLHLSHRCRPDCNFTCGPSPLMHSGRVP